MIYFRGGFASRAVCCFAVPLHSFLLVHVEMRLLESRAICCNAVPLRPFLLFVHASRVVLYLAFSLPLCTVPSFIAQLVSMW